MNPALRNLALAALAIAALAGPARAGGLALGDPAPLADVAMKNVDGREVTIASVRGAKGTLVVFSCNACPWAQAWESRIVELGNASAKRGIGVIMINPNDPEVVREDGYDQMVKRAKAAKMAFPYVVDATSEVAKAFGAARTPEAFLFDAAGKLVYHGTIDDNAKAPREVKRRFLRDALDAVVAGRDVAVAETKALGCSIKWRKSTSS